MHTFHFEALNLSLEVIRALGAGKVVERIRQSNPALAEQLTDAASSVSANLGEGRRRVGRDRIQRFRIADGSAYETKVHLHTALRGAGSANRRSRRRWSSWIGCAR